MKLLNITANYPAEGDTDLAGIFIHRQWRLLTQAGWDIRVVNAQPFLYRWIKGQSGDYPGRSVNDGIRVYRPRFLMFARMSISQLQVESYSLAVDRLVRSLTDWSPDVIVCDWLVPGMPVAVAIARRLNIPLVLRARGTDLVLLLESAKNHTWLVNFYRFLAPQPCAVICNGVGLYEDVLRLRLFDVSRVFDSPNGLDTNLYSPPKQHERIALRNALDLSPDAFVWIFVGRWEIAKGSQTLAAALPSLLQIFANVIVMIVGPILDEESQRRLEEIQGVRFLGAQPAHRIPHLLKSADAFILPSFREGTPNALLEAMATGLACVSTTVGGIRAFARPDENMISIEPGDISGLATAFTRVTHNSILREALGQAARATILDNGYDINEVVRSLDQLLMGCIDRR